VELDSSYFVRNAPGWASLQGRDRRADGEGLATLLPRPRTDSGSTPGPSCRRPFEPSCAADGVDGPGPAG